MNKEEWSQIYLDEILTTRTGNEDEGFFEYFVELQDEKFKIWVTDKEMEEAINIALLIVEELMLLPQNGMDSIKFADIRKSADAFETHGSIEYILTIEKILNENLKNLISKAASTVRVGGAYFLFLARPIISSAIYAVFEKLVDDLDNEEIQFCGGYFLLRAILKMRGDVVE